jgi:hypothetical protein
MAGAAAEGGGGAPMAGMMSMPRGVGAVGGLRNNLIEQYDDCYGLTINV